MPGITGTDHYNSRIRRLGIQNLQSAAIMKVTVLLVLLYVTDIAHGRRTVEITMRAFRRWENKVNQAEPSADLAQLLHSTGECLETVKRDGTT